MHWQTYWITRFIVLRFVRPPFVVIERQLDRLVRNSADKWAWAFVYVKETWLLYTYISFNTGSFLFIYFIQRIIYFELTHQL